MHQHDLNRNGQSSESDIPASDIRALYEKYAPMVFRRCHFLLRDEDMALDAMQDVFVRVLERGETLTHICCSFLYRVATTVSLNKIRGEKLRRHLNIDERVLLIAENRGDTHEDRTLASMTLEKLFTGMKENTQYMAVLHYVDGLTLEETAQEMHMSVSGVRKRLSVLRNKMKSEGYEL